VVPERVAVPFVGAVTIPLMERVSPDPESGSVSFERGEMRLLTESSLMPEEIVSGFAVGAELLHGIFMVIVPVLEIALFWSFVV
jgi:hypothetical protein